MINIKSFIADLRKVFGEGIKLPIAVWRSEEQAGEIAAMPHCMFAAIPELEVGKILSFTKEKLHCGGRLYCGFAPLNPGIPNFVSNVERYKRTPDMVREYIERLGIELTSKPYLNFARIDRLESFEDIEGIFFLASPDIIAGLCAWAFYDHNEQDAVTCAFASGCCATITNLVNENKSGGYRTFLGMMDISVRPYIGQNEQSFAIPFCRLEEMTKTLHECCLWEAPAWQKLKKRIGNEE